jgi:hypothetical protein
MAMWLPSALALLLNLLSPATASAQVSTSAQTAANPANEPTDIIGLGNKSCGDWTAAARENGWSKAAYHAWLGGFMSGMNLGGASQVGNLTTGTDFNGLAAWVDNYCAANPLDQVSSAAVHLTVELLKRKAERRSQ